jgi:hypothetical protein
MSIYHLIINEVRDLSGFQIPYTIVRALVKVVGKFVLSFSELSEYDQRKILDKALDKVRD